MPRKLAIAIVGCALLLRLLIPQGWMPVQAASGGWQITICTGSGPMRMTMPADSRMAIEGTHHRSPAGQDPMPGDHPCAFSSLALAVHEPLPPALDLPRLALSAWIAGPAAIVGIGRGLAAPPPPQTGPPARI